MMTAYSGNRGTTFEAFIEFANARYKANGTAIVEKQHTKFIPLRNGAGKIVNAKVEEKATVDFMGRFGNRPIAFEAKHCSKDVIALNRVEPHQAEFLRQWTKDATAIGFVLVSFKFTDFYLIPWPYWEMALIAREQKILRAGKRLPMLTEWAATGKASIRKDELPTEWKVKAEATVVGLDYLERVSSLWMIGKRSGKVERGTEKTEFPGRRAGGGRHIPADGADYSRGDVLDKPAAADDAAGPRTGKIPKLGHDQSEH